MDTAEARKVAECVRYVHRLTQDVQALLAASGTLLEQHGYLPLRKTLVATDADDKFQSSEAWMSLAFGRLYGKLSDPKSKEEINHMYAIEVHLAPRFVDQPCVVLGSLALSEKRERRQLWASWQDWFGSTLDEDVQFSETIELGDEQTAEVHSDVSRCRLTLVRLADVGDEAAVRERIVAPLLAL